MKYPPSRLSWRTLAHNLIHTARGPNKHLSTIDQKQENRDAVKREFHRCRLGDEGRGPPGNLRVQLQLRSGAVGAPPCATPPRPPRWGPARARACARGATRLLRVGRVGLLRRARARRADVRLHLRAACARRDGQSGRRSEGRAGAGERAGAALCWRRRLVRPGPPPRPRGPWGDGGAPSPPRPRGSADASSPGVGAREGVGGEQRPLGSAAI